MDLYVHAAPDLLPRADDDLALAETCRQAGLAAAIHRNHFGSTVERADLALRATGFPLLGAIVGHDAIGGLNPTAVELALRLGAVWVGMPTLSARHFRGTLGNMPDHLRSSLGLGPGKVVLLDDEAKLRPEVRAIIDLTAEHNAVLGLGYGTPAECDAVLNAALDAGVAGVVLTYPHLIGLDREQIRSMVSRDGVFLEICAYGMHPSGPTAGANVDDNLALIRHVGPARCILSSDGGMAGSPPPAALLEWAAGTLLEAGFIEQEIKALVHDNPRIALAPRASALGVDL